MTSDPRSYLGPLAEASKRLVRTVDGFHGDDWTAPTGLPGWSRAHVVAHLVLNAEGLANALRGVVSDDPTPPMYISQQVRNDDIEELAAAEHDVPRARLLAGCTAFTDAFSALPEDQHEAPIERVPGGQTFPAGSAVLMRLREVEIHHADLDTGYHRSQWSPEFVLMVLESSQARDWPVAFCADPDDVDGTFTYGEGDGPTVTGSGADIAWWLTGRGSGEGVTSATGELPEVPAW